MIALTSPTQGPAKLDRAGVDFDARRAERGREVRRGAATPERQLTWVMR